MNLKLLATFALAGATMVFAHAQTYLGTVDLTYVGQGSNDGPFEWTTSSGDDVYTYCFSTANLFSPAENPQVFQVWSMAGATASSTVLTDILSENQQPGLTNTTFLEAAAEAEFFGTPDPLSAYVGVNADIHATESNGNSLFDGLDYSEFLYLLPDNPSSYAYAGQPQGYISPGGGGNLNPTPGPLSALPMAFGLGSLVMRRRRKAS